MAQWELVTTAANGASKHVFRARFNTNPCSDVAQLQAWDDFNPNSVASQMLAGFTANSNESLVAAASTDAAATGASWAPANATAGGALVNRLRGEESYVLLGAAAPGVGDDRLFNLIMGCHADSAIGLGGNTPAFAVKAFYAAAAPDIEFYYNRGADDLGAGVGADWILMTSADKGVNMAIGVKNAIFAADASGASPASSLSPVTKPGSGEKFAPEHWVQTQL
jgi:hypothetical protein